MKKVKTSDGFFVTRIKKEREYYYLADQTNYKNEITNLLNTLEDLKFDSLIFLFGIDTGAYLPELKKKLCQKNHVFIFEPNKTIHNNITMDLGDNIKLVYYQEDVVKQIFEETIDFKNLNNIFFYSFGNYSTLYKKEYDQLIEHLDWTIIKSASQVSLAKRFKKIFIKNMIANLKIIPESTPIHRYLFTNTGVPAIVVSGGASLDKNMEDMKRYKDLVKNCFVITGSRTVDALIKNGIMPDMIVSVDPVNANFDMMKDHLDLKVPLAFYEYSNRYLLKNYQGEKIFISLLLSRTIKGMEHLKAVYCGGSVSHACVDIASMLGCSPILLTGQDLAYTHEKHHADSATFSYDSTLDYRPQTFVKDIYGNLIGTTVTLDYFRKNLELYISQYKNQDRVRFYNCSYGAEIEGAPHKELGDILLQTDFSKKKIPCLPSHELTLDAKETIDSLMEFLEDSLIKAGQGLELCELIRLENKTKSLVEVEEDDIDLQRILYILQLVNSFENNPYSSYLGGYFSEFLYEIKEKNISMQAKDYDKLTSDLQYQASFFQEYFLKLHGILSEVRETASSTVSEFYESHIV
ncbi:motility associated factor glycosyltransferase family protein [Lacrimispora sp.]|uniref:motility associated factor glycosyltransferase family protein n=1 Tax=Lacrimispora sp. TaxID=2719234 RepID=UPI0028B0CFBC|nr:6-hydroxymethylpterin diphosphokinase MptE-like protein [Lacrimispora sp.]